MARAASTLLMASLSTCFLLGKVSASGGEVTSNITTCRDIKNSYKSHSCCREPDKVVNLQLVPGSRNRLQGLYNVCAGKKPDLPNHDCIVNGVVDALEQAGGDVTVGYIGGLVTNVTPITDAFYTGSLCPVNVHWHIGTEHRSAGQYDENGTAPGLHPGPPSRQIPSTRRLLAEEEEDSSRLRTYDENGNRQRRLAGGERYGYACHLYDANDPKFTTPYEWKHCSDMYVGETYEVHWPHSALGKCATPDQYQTPFYDGVFCKFSGPLPPPQDIASAIGVQAQIFVVVNDESYYYPNLMAGMIVDGGYGQNITAYTGSTTGTSRDNTICSAYTPITWQVDRTCQLISASSFDKMCADMKQQRDNMAPDTVPHGSRELVRTILVANNQVFNAAAGR